jgi:hypothetical protein
MLKELEALKMILKGLPFEVAKRMTFEEQLTRETWIKKNATPQHTFLVPPLKDPYQKKSWGEIPLRGEGCNTPGVTQGFHSSLHY